MTIQMVQMGAERKVVPCKTRKTGNDLKTTHAILLHDPEAQDNGRGNASQLVGCITWHWFASVLPCVTLAQRAWAPSCRALLICSS